MSKKSTISNHGFKFGPSFRLKGRDKTERLFKNGLKLRQGKFRLYLIKCEDTNNKYLIGVPKRKLKKASDRNNIKRLVRESIRLFPNKQFHLLGYHIALVYNYEGQTSFLEVQQTVNDLFQEMALTIAK